jgi:hypothetical protein
MPCAQEGFQRCDGIKRRDALRIGMLTGLGTIGTPGLSVFDWMQLKLHAASHRSHAKSCILLWLDGGPSHLEMWDLKPDAPSEVRGPFEPINTRVPGIQICELLPETAKLAHHLAIVRSVTSPLGEHGIANQYLLTGYEPNAALQYPSYGSVVAHTRSNPIAMPPYIVIPESRFAGAGFLGAAREPFSLRGDPASPQFRVRDIELFPEVDEARLLRRKHWLEELDAIQKNLDQEQPKSNGSLEQAYRMVLSPESKGAFDLMSESDETRQRYGPRTFGQSCLLARRLVERGVPFITVQHSGWDTHENLELQLKSGFAGAKVGVGLIPTFDLAFSALLRDLEDRRMLDETLVIAMGEFGRTPKLNARGGRDHWPRVFSMVMAGGGVRGGQVIGASDRTGESPLEAPVTPKDIAFTVYSILGIDPRQELITTDGRPIPINQGGQMIQGILGI